MKLTTSYLGLELKHPIVASAGPISYSLDGIKKLEDSNAAAIVMFSLFEEQIRCEDEHADRMPSADPDAYLTLVRNAVEATDVPIIGIGGIQSIDDVMEFLVTGASAVQIGTANFYNPGLAGELVDDLQRTLAEEQCLSVKEVVGTLRFGKD